VRIVLCLTIGTHTDAHIFDMEALFMIRCWPAAYLREGGGQKRVSAMREVAMVTRVFTWNHFCGVKFFIGLCRPIRETF
jgi:hypothetical protein